MWIANLMRVNIYEYGTELDLMGNLRRWAFFNTFQIEKWIFLRGPLIGIPFIFFLAYFYNEMPIISKYVFCIVRQLFHIPCPGCGLTRSFIAIVHGQFVQSYDSHPAGLIIVIYLLYIFLRKCVEYLFKILLPNLFNHTQRTILIAVFASAIVFRWLLILLM